MTMGALTKEEEDELLATRDSALRMVDDMATHSEELRVAESQRMLKIMDKLRPGTLSKYGVLRDGRIVKLVDTSPTVTDARQRLVRRRK